jgi:predicted ArsR family transcriptional regulator
MQEAVLVAMREAGTPITSSALASYLGVHITTARYHLDRLVARGTVVRWASAHSGVRGRPQLTYALIDAEAARNELVALLAGMVDRGEGATSAVEAGRAWADGIPDVEPNAHVALERELAVRGFAPERTALGFDLHDCPFRDAARQSPGVVCALHLGLTQGLADRADGDGSWRVALEPLVRPTLCRVSMARERAA